mmetsp:Transcript_31372/g.78462  ORF Transcript_31372/g.78462 Transcript_31372/m.78462 type:complete len:221 (-) Transcript_31372:15-677(-)
MAVTYSRIRSQYSLNSSSAVEGAPLPDALAPRPLPRCLPRPRLPRPRSAPIPREEGAAVRKPRSAATAPRWSSGVSAAPCAGVSCMAAAWTGPPAARRRMRSSGLSFRSTRILSSTGPRLRMRWPCCIRQSTAARSSAVTRSLKDSPSTCSIVAAPSWPNSIDTCASPARRFTTSAGSLMLAMYRGWLSWLTRKVVMCSSRARAAQSAVGLVRLAPQPES